MMMVDSCEDDWLSLHDIRLNGPILEYVGRGKSVADVGLAQAKHPICTRHHYFEIEVRTYRFGNLYFLQYPKLEIFHNSCPMNFFAHLVSTVKGIIFPP